MADNIEELERALLAADKAAQTGDQQAQQDAQVLANEIIRLRESKTPLSALETAGDYAQSLGTGLRQGAEGMMGLPGDLRNLISRGAAGVAGKFGASPETQESVRDFAQNAPLMPHEVVAKMAGKSAPLPNTSEIQQATTKVVGKHHQPKTTGGEYARTIGQFAPAALGGPGSLMTRVGTQVVAPAVMSEAAGQLTKGTQYEPFARLGGAVAGGFTGSLLRKARMPGGRIDPERARQAVVLRKAGVDLTGGQATGRASLKFKEANLGGAKAQNWNENQMKQFTRAAFKKAGFPEVKLATTKNMKSLFKRVGGKFDELEGNTSIKPTNKLITDLNDALKDYAELVGSGNQATRPTKIVEGLLEHIQRTGEIPGKAVKTLRTQISSSVGKSKESGLTDALLTIRDSLDDAMEETLKASGSPHIGAWRKVRQDYRNLLVFEKAKQAAGETAALGMISPAQLASAVKTKLGRRNYVKGNSELAELAEAGVGMMSPLRDSGTADNIFNSLGGRSVASGGLGATVGGAVGGVPGAMAGGAIGVGAPKLAGAAMMSRPGRNYLSQVYPWQKVSTPAVNPLISPAIAALMARPSITPK